MIVLLTSSDDFTTIEDRPPASYTESYQSWEKVSDGRIVKSYEPTQGDIGYETGNKWSGCWYSKCANGYAYYETNDNCTKGHKENRSFASGWPECPHGRVSNPGYWIKANCYYDIGYDKPGYKARCGRTTTKAPDDYGYVTRTRTTTYTYLMSQHYHSIHLIYLITETYN